MRKILFVSLLFTAFASYAAKKKSKLSLCLEKAVSTYEMSDCIGVDYSKKDAKLNKVYQELLSEVNKKEDQEKKAEIKKRVVEAERAWIKYRDTSCNVEGIDMLGGTGERLIYADCLLKMTRERTKYLVGLQKSLTEGSSDCEEGDVSCGK